MYSQTVMIILSQNATVSNATYCRMRQYVALTLNLAGFRLKKASAIRKKLQRIFFNLREMRILCLGMKMKQQQ